MAGESSFDTRWSAPLLTTCTTQSTAALHTVRSRRPLALTLASEQLGTLRRQAWGRTKRLPRCSKRRRRARSHATPTRRPRAHSRLRRSSAPATGTECGA